MTLRTENMMAIQVFPSFYDVNFNICLFNVFGTEQRNSTELFPHERRIINEVRRACASVSYFIYGPVII